MKTDLKAKYIQHLINKKKNDEGFTLIELLVVIIIIGILSAIALPSFLNQANKAKQSEAKTYVGSMNRGQQSYYTEETEFTDSINDMGIGIESATNNYDYSAVTLAGSGTTVLHGFNRGVTKKLPLRSYYGGVYATVATATEDSTTIAYLCEFNTSGIQTYPGAAAETTCAAPWEGI